MNEPTVDSALVWADLPLALPLCAVQAALLGAVAGVLLGALPAWLLDVSFVSAWLWTAGGLALVLWPLLIRAALTPAAESKPLLVMTAGMNQ